MIDGFIVLDGLLSAIELMPQDALQQNFHSIKVVIAIRHLYEALSGEEVGSLPLTEVIERAKNLVKLEIKKRNKN